MAAKPPGKAAKVQTLILAESLDLPTATALRAEILGLRGAPVTLDASSVQRIGGLCLQVLLAARAAWRADDKAFSITGASPEVRNTLERVGAGDLVEGTA
jgi:chemotaxis protein CheX